MLSSRSLVVISFVLSIFVLSSGCVSQSPGEKSQQLATQNLTLGLGDEKLILADIFTAPIGGFEEKYARQAIADPNSTYETSYIFYSRNASGSIQYNLTINYDGKQYLADDNIHLIVDPAEFHINPNRSYRSRVYLNTSYLPKDFYDYASRHAIFPARLVMNVSLDNKTVKYGHDEVFLYPEWRTGPPFLDILLLENCSVSVRRGETKHINAEFHHNSTSGIGYINFIAPKALLDISFIPQNFIVKHDVNFPVTLFINASDPSLIPGKYSVIVNTSGFSDTFKVFCGETQSYSDFNGNFPINVTVT